MTGPAWSTARTSPYERGRAPIRRLSNGLQAEGVDGPDEHVTVVPNSELCQPSGQFPDAPRVVGQAGDPTEWGHLLGNQAGELDGQDFRLPSARPGQHDAVTTRLVLEAERSTEGFAKKKEADARRREKAQVEYVGTFYNAVVTFLAFHPDHSDVAARLARAVMDHATPVGSGTVARTRQVPLERRVEAAVIAWLRHATTAYESMVIPHVKGQRREVRRMLAQKSKELLGRYRRGAPVGAECPLKRGLGLGTTTGATGCS